MRLAPTTAGDHFFGLSGLQTAIPSGNAVVMEKASMLAIAIPPPAALAFSNQLCHHTNGAWPMSSLRRSTRRFYRPALAFFLLLVSVFPSMAETWPQRPVKFIATLGPGSGVDFGTRLLGDRLSKRWGQPVVIENRPGGDAIVAVSAVISANDDHVLLASPTSALTAHPYVLQQMPYKDSDLLPIARGWNTVIVIAVPAAMEVKTMHELVAMTRANPGQLNWAGTTGAIDFLFAGFLKKNNLDMKRVPYRNPQDAANDVATERIQVTEASLATLRPQLQAGKIKMLASTNSIRPPSNPEVPTVTEGAIRNLRSMGLWVFSARMTCPRRFENISPPTCAPSCKSRISAKS
jgi:tripartite-type tricarboxylate transporter receptor subunit TctC